MKVALLSHINHYFPDQKTVSMPVADPRNVCGSHCSFGWLTAKISPQISSRVSKPGFTSTLIYYSDLKIKIGFFSQCEDVPDTKDLCTHIHKMPGLMKPIPQLEPECDVSLTSLRGTFKEPKG